MKLNKHELKFLHVIIDEFRAAELAYNKDDARLFLDAANLLNDAISEAANDGRDGRTTPLDPDWRKIARSIIQKHTRSIIQKHNGGLPF